MKNKQPSNENVDWQLVRYVLGGVIGFAAGALLLTYSSIVTLIDHPHAAAMVSSALISVLMGAPLIVTAAMQYRRGERLRSQLNHITRHDAATGCITGQGLVQHANGLERRRKRSGASLQGALICVRVNNLDEVGSAFGPQWSDELLQFVASTISTSIRREDVIARTGPTTFDVLLVDASEADANNVCARLFKALASAHFSANGRPVDLALSVGGALYDGSLDLERLHRTAASRGTGVVSEQAPTLHAH